MKKLIILMSIFGIFILASCDDGNSNYYYDNPTSSNPTTEEPVNTGTEESPKTDTTQGDSQETNPKQDTEEEKKNDESVYDDNIEWGPLH